MTEVAALACPECAAPVREREGVIVCDGGHDVGRATDGILDFTRPRVGVDAELVAFWRTSPAYYETARGVNVDYSDEGHASHRALIETLRAAGVRRILDVGCGSGELAAELADRLPGVEYVGVDVSTLAVREAHELGRPGSYLAADAERLPFADQSFDAAVTLYALEHFAAPRDALAELARVVRPGGLVGLLTLSYDRIWGTIPSVRLGLVWRGRKLPRLHPANLAVYGFNRLRFVGRQAFRQLVLLTRPRHAAFDLVGRPLVLDAPYSADLDAVHIVSGRSVARFLEELGLEIVESSIPPGWRGWLAPPLDLRIVAKKHARGSDA